MKLIPVFKQISCFQCNELPLRNKLILTPEDSSSSFVIGEDTEQEINEVSDLIIRTVRR